MKGLSSVLNLTVVLRTVLSDSSSLTCCLSTHQPTTLFVYHLHNMIENNTCNIYPVGNTRTVAADGRDISKYTSL